MHIRIWPILTIGSTRCSLYVKHSGFVLGKRNGVLCMISHNTPAQATMPSYFPVDGNSDSLRISVLLYHYGAGAWMYNWPLFSFIPICIYIQWSSISVTTYKRKPENANTCIISDFNACALKHQSILRVVIYRKMCKIWELEIQQLQQNSACCQCLCACVRVEALFSKNDAVSTWFALAFLLSTCSARWR